MADYKLNIHFTSGECITINARNQSDNIDEFSKKMSNMNAGYFTNTYGSDSVMVNTNSVTYIEINKIEKENKNA